MSSWQCCACDDSQSFLCSLVSLLLTHAPPPSGKQFSSIVNKLLKDRGGRSGKRHARSKGTILPLPETCWKVMSPICNCSRACRAVLREGILQSLPPFCAALRPPFHISQFPPREWQIPEPGGSWTCPTAHRFSPSHWAKECTTMQDRPVRLQLSDCLCWF